MPQHTNPLNPQVSTGPGQVDVPAGGIGATIADDGPGRLQQFFTNPKNLATLLVLGASLSKQKRPGQSDLNQLLQSGVGATAFRGGLDRGISDDRQASAEAASVITGREATATNQRDQTAAIREQTVAQGVNVEAQITGRGEVADAALAQQREIEHAQIVQQTYYGTLQSYREKLIQNALSGLPPPNLQEMWKDAAISLAAGGFIPDPSFAADALTAIVPPPGGTGVAGVPGVTQPDQLAADAIVPEPIVPTRSIPAVDRHGNVDKLNDEQFAARVLKGLRLRAPEAVEGLTPEQAVTKVEQLNLTVSNALATMTPEEARAIKADKNQRNLLTIENLRAVNKRATEDRASRARIQPII